MFDGFFDMFVLYIVGWYQVFVCYDCDVWYLVVEIFMIWWVFGKLKYFVGLEFGVGIWINDVMFEVVVVYLWGVFIV